MTTTPEAGDTLKLSGFVIGQKPDAVGHFVGKKYFKMADVNLKLCHSL